MKKILDIINRLWNVCGQMEVGALLTCRSGIIIWGGSREKVHNVRSRKVEKTAIKVMTCHKYACKRVSQKMP